MYSSTETNCINSVSSVSLLLTFVHILMCVNALTETIHCDVVIAGGSTSALSAALQAARKGFKSSYIVCLTEPTDWLGGQLTSSAVSAVDFGQWNRNWWFQSETFQAMMKSLGAGNPGRCWVSTKCYLPRDLIDNFINKQVDALPNLRVFYNTVIKSVQINGSVIERVDAIQRFERRNVKQWTHLTSETINDWYTQSNSSLFTKKFLHFAPRNNNRAIIIDGTEFGDVLVLSNAPFRQGVEIPTEDSSSVNDMCGQRFTIPFYVKYDQNNSSFYPTPVTQYGSYSLDNTPWGKVWSYRRSKGTAGQAFHDAHPGEVSNQNWSHGNDFYDKSLFLSITETNDEISDWRGGINVGALQLAESRAYGWYQFFKQQSPKQIHQYLTIGRSDIIGTETGLSKIPYIRDTRRSIGLNGFVLKKSDMDQTSCSTTSIAPEHPSNKQQRPLNCSEYSTKFHDTIALGNYVADVHGVSGCSWPQYINNYHTLPFHIPFRALTNFQYDNLLVTGKTMAQTFMANAATRTHPTEFAVGEAAGIAASLMLKHIFTTSDMYSNINLLQRELAKESPIYWDKPRTTPASEIVG